MQDPLLLDHEYDGIRELDNKLPRWWVWLFYGSIVFAVFYMCYYHLFHAGDLQEAAYLKEYQAGEAVKNATMSRFEASFLTLTPSKDQAIVDHGHQIFARSCAPCQRADGGGLVGPNLCDDYWIHGSNFSDNLTTIWNGVPAKGMITWKKFLKPDEVYSVASYIYTLRGTHPPNPKPPENQQSTKPSIFD
jgi:cytochrome c oxidase cbb3-type subunit 3